jgi:hypothetical protein
MRNLTELAIFAQVVEEEESLGSTTVGYGYASSCGSVTSLPVAKARVRRM